MNDAALVALPIEAYVGFFALLIVSIAVMYWGMAVQDRKRRAAFLASHDADDLLQNRYNPRVIYKVLSRDAETIKTMTVWRGKYPERHGDVFEADAKHFVAFDETLFKQPNKLG